MKNLLIRCVISSWYCTLSWALLPWHDSDGKEEVDADRKVTSAVSIWSEREKGMAFKASLPSSLPQGRTQDFNRKGALLKFIWKTPILIDHIYNYMWTRSLIVDTADKPHVDAQPAITTLITPYQINMESVCFVHSISQAMNLPY